MTDTDPQQPDLSALRATAEDVEFAQAAYGLVTADGYYLAGAHPLAPLARGIARSVTEAGLAVHRCAQHEPLFRLGGVCILTVPAESGTGHGGIAVCWTAYHLLLLDREMYGTYTRTQQVMNAALGGVLRAFGYPVRPFGSAGAWLVTGPRGTEVGR